MTVAEASISTGKPTDEPLVGAQMCTPFEDGALHAVEASTTTRGVRSGCDGIRRAGYRGDAARCDGIRIELFRGVTEGEQMIIVVLMNFVDWRGS